MRYEHADLVILINELSATREKLKAAEKRIRESQEQKPEGYGWDEKRGHYAVYAMPPIPPELAELQRENSELRKKLESLND